MLNLQNAATGGRFLETSIRALQRLMEGCGESFHEHVTAQLWQLLLKAVSHTNRFVRETGFLCINTLCQISPLEVLKEYVPITQAAPLKSCVILVVRG